ncbi:DUF5688 family protein [Oribacterium sp. C9]|uniref:DUF5688 family protein n=1 Tax=Oribacterium sp. C9 TaxID=1943579 RepID=UPI00143CB983|nr:DUF5688 family protein [Oribacterium sp. C9]
MASQMGIAASEFGMDTADAHMFILTNAMYNNGAAVIAYPGFLEEMAERLKDNLIIIPSSIHEVIVLRESEINDDVPIGEHIRDVNKSCMEQSEILSDHAYRYDAALKKLEALES